VILAESMDVGEVLLFLKIAFLVLLYLFIWRIVRTASRDLRIPQESMILRPGDAEALGLARSPAKARLVVVKSGALDEGEEFALDSSALTVGRGHENNVRIDGDDFVSTTHAKFSPRHDGVWIEDNGSTNGTYLNGIRLTRARKLAQGDIVRIGETDLRFES
jgi:hypothetical protein